MRLLLASLLAVMLTAQDSRFDARSRLVLLPTNVFDAQGHPVDGLEAADFLVLDNDRPQKPVVDTIGTGVAPIALVIAVQSSGISQPVLDKVRKIAGLIQPLITGERGCAALLSFAERVKWLQKCTTDADALAYAFQRLQPGENKKARMLDAVSSAITHLGEQPRMRRVLLLISESRDRGSEAELPVVTAAAQSAGVVVYAATYSVLKTPFTSKSQVTQQTPADAPPGIANPNHTYNGAPPSKYNPLIPPPENRLDILAGISELARLHKAEDTGVLSLGTGGTTFPFTRQQGLNQAIEKLGAELHEQYVLSFAPESTGPGYHVIQVRVLREGQFRVRTRPGYWSAGE